MGPGWQVLRAWMHHCVGALEASRAEIDALNVFPVPDGDTGTNVWLTMESARVEVDEQCDQGASITQVAHGLARGALMGARGNSGVIMSQILRGVGEIVGAKDHGDHLSGIDVSAMLRRGESLAYQAVAEPVEGTILTVARAAADAAERAAHAGDDVVHTAQRAAQAAHEALARTPDLLPVLRQAGVVDAGGRSLTVVLDALVAALTGREVDIRPTRPVVAPANHVPSVDYEGPAYEVMYLLDAKPDDIDDLRDALSALGDSLVIVGDEHLWNVHVHVDDPGAAVEAALAVGRPHRIRITHLKFISDRPRRGRRLVAVTHGPGTAAVLDAVGVLCVPAEAKQPPSTAALLSVMAQSQAEEYVVLPSDSDIRAVADLAAEQARQNGLRVSVIPTRSIVQTLAAAAVHDPDVRFDDDVVAMTRAASATRYAALTTASRAALTMAGECRVGDTLGLLEGDIACISPDWLTAAQHLLTAMLAGGGELITLVFGSEADETFHSQVESWVRIHAPFAEVMAYEGGQPLWPLIIGVE
jgi:uncharacterized protein